MAQYYARDAYLKRPHVRVVRCLGVQIRIVPLLNGPPHMPRNGCPPYRVVLCLRAWLPTSYACAWVAARCQRARQTRLMWWTNWLRRSSRD